MILLLRLVFCGFAAYRLARALAVDSISEPLRMALYTAAYGPEPVSDSTTPRRPLAWLYGLISCAFCCSFWLALGLYASWVNWGWTRPLTAAVAVAGLASILTAGDHAMTK